MLGRAAFVLVFFGLELGGIAWGMGSPDHVLGFQMFNESSRISIALFREVERGHQRVLLPLPKGRWRVRDAHGKRHDYAWQDRVQTPPLYVLGQSMHAPYGLKAQLFRLQAALEDVVRHIPDDTRTLALVADVSTIHNGRPGSVVRLRAEKP